jgi:hypothetical protein
LGAARILKAIHDPRKCELTQAAAENKFRAEGDPTLLYARKIVALLIVLSVVLLPIGGAFASASSHQMAGMEDCSKGNAASDHCSGCDAKAKCPEAFCIMKCFQLTGEIRPTAKLSWSPFQYVRLEHEKPPDWVSRPPAPPPRS